MPTQELSSHVCAPTSLLGPDSEVIAAPEIRNDFRPKKKPKPAPQRALPPTVNTTSAKGKSREDMPVATAQLEQGEWLGLLDHILRELKERFGPSGADPSGVTQTFLCEVLSAILLRFYRAYSLEKLFGEGNSGPKGAVKDAIEQDNQEMSLEALAAFAARHSYRPISTLKGNRAPLGRPKILTGRDFFDCIWGGPSTWDVTRALENGGLPSAIPANPPRARHTRTRAGNAPKA